MSHPHPAGLLAAYNSLTDKHLAGYFNNTRIRRHLLRSGLITRNGRVLSEKEYKVNIMKQEHQKYIRECLAQAIFHKVLDIERNRQMEIKRKLESSAKKERIQRLKGEHTRRFVESNIPILSPHPPPGPKTNRGHSVLVDQGDPSPLTLTAPRPYTAPGNMQPPIRLQPLLSNYSARNASKFTPGPRSKTSFLEKEAPFPIGGKKAMMKFRNSLNNSQRVSTYHLPDINRYTMPAPPPLPPSGKVFQEHKSEPWRRRRRLRPITAPNGLEPLFTRDSGRIHKTSLHSNAVITMVYLGKNVHLSHDDRSFQDEIKVYQQHCGGENLCVYKGKLLEKDTFQFISKRHHGFPFSLTFFLNGMQVNRLSSCCEFKHRRSSRLGGKGGYFGFVCVEKASPCYRCIIAMGLDRKASSVKPRRDKSTEKREELRKGQGKPRKNRENLKSRTKEIKGDESSVSAMFSAQELMGVREVRTAMEEMELKRKPSQDVWEEDQENTFKYDYEEDFEVEEEKQDDKANEDRQAYDQMNRISKSPTGSEKDNLVLKKEREISPQKTPDAEDLEDEDIGCLDSDGEEDKQDIKTASSISSRSYPYSSESDDESSERDRKAYTGSSTNQSTGSSPSPERNEGDKPGKRRLPADDSLQTEMKKEVTKADVKDRPLLTEEEMEKGAWEIVEDGSEKLREPASQEAKDEPERWEGSPGQEYDRKAGVLGVEEGVGQILSEALAPGFHSDSDITSGTRHSEEVSEPMRKLEMDSSGAPSWNYVVEKRAALTSEEKSKNVVREIPTLEKKVLTEEDAAPRPGDAQTAGGELKEKAGATKVPLEERRETAKREALAAQTSEGRRRPGDSVTLRGDTGEPALVSSGLEAREAVSAGEQGLEKTWLADRPTLSPQPLQRRKAVAPETPETKSGGAEGAAGPPTPVVGDKSGEKTPTGPEDPGPGQDPGREGEAGACGLEGWASSTPEEGAAREGTVTLGESDREDDRAEMSPEAFNAARERGKAKRAQTPPNDAGPETGEGTRAKALRGGDAVQSNQGHEEEPAKEIKSEEETRASPNEREPDADRAQPRGATDLKKDGTGLLEDSLRDGTVTLFEAAPPCEESLEKAVAGQPAHKAWAELPGQNLTSPQPGMEESYHDPQGSGGTAGREPPSDKAHTPEGAAPAPGQGEEGARQELEGLAGLQRKDGESPLQAAPNPRPSLEEAPEGDPTLPGNCRGAEEEGRTQGTSEMKDSLAEGDRASGGGEGGPAGTEEGLHGGLAVTASERREKWARCSQVAEGHTVASKASFSGVAAEGMWQEAGQPPAEGRVEVALSPGEARLGTPRKDPEGQASRLGQGQGQEGGMGTCREDGAAEEGGQGPSSHNAPELSKEPLQAAAPLPEKPDFSGTCEAEDAQGRKLLS